MIVVPSERVLYRMMQVLERVPTVELDGSRNIRKSLEGYAKRVDGHDIAFT